MKSECTDTEKSDELSSWNRIGGVNGPKRKKEISRVDLRSAQEADGKIVCVKPPFRSPGYL